MKLLPFEHKASLVVTAQKVHGWFTDILNFGGTLFYIYTWETGCKAGQKSHAKGTIAKVKADHQQMGKSHQVMDAAAGVIKSTKLVWGS